MITLAFTAKEADFLLHRLTIADAMAECLIADADEDEPMLDAQVTLIEHRIDEVAHELSTRITYVNRYTTHYVDVDPASELDEAILVDAVEGSTWYGSMEGATPVERAAAYRVMERAAAKIAAAFDLDRLNVPTY